MSRALLGTPLHPQQSAMIKKGAISGMQRSPLPIIEGYTSIPCNFLVPFKGFDTVSRCARPRLESPMEVPSLLLTREHRRRRVLVPHAHCTKREYMTEPILMATSRRAAH